MELKKNYMFRAVSLKVLVLLFFLILFRGCSEKADESDSQKYYGGNINIGMIGNIGSLFPYSLKEYYSQEISRYLLNPALTVSGADNNPVADLAAKWQVGEDNRSITYFLNKDFRWSNGRALNGGDVIESYKFILKNSDRIDSSLKQKYISGVRLIDSLTVCFTFNKSITDPFRFTRFPVIPFEYIDLNKDLNATAQKYMVNFTGCGPFLLESKNNHKIVLKKNTRYPGGVPYLDKITFCFYKNLDSLLLALKQNKLHFIYSIPVSALSEISGLSGYNIKTDIENGFTFIGWNLRKPLLKSRNVRKALTYALDRVTMVDGILSGYGNVQDAPSYPKFWAYYNAKPLEYDPHKAVELLEKEGWNERTEKGILKKDGQAFSINIITNRESRIHNELGVNTRANYNALGIDACIENLSWTRLLNRLESGRFDGVIINWVENDAYDLPKLFHSSNIKSGINFMSYNNPTVDRLLENAMNGADKDIRSENWREFQKYIINDLPITVLFNKKIISVVSDKLQNVEINSYGFLKSAKVWSLNDRK